MVILLGRSNKSKVYVGLTPLVGNGADTIYLLFLTLFIPLEAAVSYWLSGVRTDPAGWYAWRVLVSVPQISPKHVARYGA